MPLHTSEYAFRFYPEKAIGAFQYDEIIGVITCSKLNRFRQIWAHVASPVGASSPAFKSEALLEFYDGYILPDSVDVCGLSLGTFNTRVYDNFASGTYRQLEMEHHDNTAGQGYPLAPFYSWGTGSDGIRLGEKVLECDVACNVIRYRVRGWFNAAHNLSGILAVISSNFPARQYHEHNFASAV